MSATGKDKASTWLPTFLAFPQQPFEILLDLLWQMDVLKRLLVQSLPSLRFKSQLHNLPCDSAQVPWRPVHQLPYPQNGHLSYFMRFGGVTTPSPRPGVLWVLGVLLHTFLFSSASPTVPRVVLHPQQALRRRLSSSRTDTSSRRLWPAPHQIVKWALSVFRTVSPHLPAAPRPFSKF